MSSELVRQFGGCSAEQGGAKSYAGAEALMKLLTGEEIRPMNSRRYHFCAGLFEWMNLSIHT